MEVPEFCKRASARLAKKRKTEEETDPDYQPITETGKRPTSRTVAVLSLQMMELQAFQNLPVAGTSRSFITPAAPVTAGNANFRRERKKVRRSQAIVEELRKPTPGLQFIDRNEYSVEDYKERASEVRRNRILGTAKEIADSLVDVDSDRLAGLEYPVREVAQFGSENPYSRYVDGNGENMELDEYDFDFHNLPNYVMGTGQGISGGLPNWEFKTLWNYELTPMELDQPLDESLLPWKMKEVTEPDMKPDILSIVASFSIGCSPLNLKEIALGSRNIEYNPDRFAPLIMRVRQPKSTALIFASGRIIVAGTRSEDECRHACRKYVRVINKFGYVGRVGNLEIQNISASCSLKFRVRLNHLAKNKLFGPLSYEPEMFPGLVIPLEHPKIKIIIFQTGSVLMTGGKSEADVQLAFRKVYALVRMYAP
ncbi:TATA-box-binding protein [Orchesella cincta]|uniref:TATA-box-binding protein n=1 Tax=Orchesella cincta TaxID=48709 RepID=A0A1D2N8E6_ORCCI|nr:TATA-box-binding protein [Orchesella cincta]